MADSPKPPLLVERDAGVVTLSINDAPRNPMSLDFMDALEEQIADLAVDRSARALVITAEGDEHFSVGMHLKQMPEGVKRKGSIEANSYISLHLLIATSVLSKNPMNTVACRLTNGQ